MLVLAMTAPSAATAAPTTVVLGSTGAVQDSQLGPGVMSATFKLEGASGSGSPSSLGGGLGGSATAALDLQLGQPVKLFVGTSGGFNGGGAGSGGRPGGGGTDVRIGGTDLRDRALVAGGGGGGGNCTSPTATTAHGGAGGGLSGGDGGFGFPSNPGGPFFCNGGPGGGG